jgi:hypothetical protein
MVKATSAKKANKGRTGGKKGKKFNLHSHIAELQRQMGTHFSPRGQSPGGVAWKGPCENGTQMVCRFDDAMMPTYVLLSHALPRRDCRTIQRTLGPWVRARARLHCINKIIPPISLRESPCLARNRGRRERAVALQSSITAYTGRFRLDGDKFISQVHVALNEFYKGSEQVRYFEQTGETLRIRTPEQPSGIQLVSERSPLWCGSAKRASYRTLRIPRAAAWR